MIYCTYTPTLKLVHTVYIYKMATFLACVCPRKGGLIVFGCLQLLPWRMQFHLSFIFPHLDCIRINCNSSKFSLKFHFVLKEKKNWLYFVYCFMSCFLFELFCVRTTELGGMGVDKRKGWGEGHGARVWPRVWFLSWGRSSLLSLHLLFMQKRRKGHLDKETTWKWIEMVICGLGEMILRGGQKAVEQPECTSPLLTASEKKSKVHDPEGGCQLWHLFPRIYRCRVFFFSPSEGGSKALFLVIMQHFNQRLEKHSGSSEWKIAAYYFYFIPFKHSDSWRRMFRKCRLNCTQVFLSLPQKWILTGVMRSGNLEEKEEGWGGGKE